MCVYPLYIGTLISQEKLYSNARHMRTGNEWAKFVGMQILKTEIQNQNELEPMHVHIST